MSEKDRPRSRGMTRQSFLKATALLPVAALGAGRASGADAVKSPPAIGRYANRRFQLDYKAGAGLEVELTHLPSGLKLAEGNYSYSFGEPSFLPASVVREGPNSALTLSGMLPSGLGILQTYSVYSDQPWIEEWIIFTNQTDHAIALPDLRAGFVLPVKISGADVDSPFKDFKFTAVPFRREPTGNRTQYADYTLSQILTEPRHSELRAQVKVDRWDKVYVTETFTMGLASTDYSQYASEGWAITDGRRGFLVTKYSQEGMEWSLLDRIPLNREHLGLLWGGCGVFQGDPENVAALAPGATYRCGTTRLTAFEGGIREGYYTFRAEMESRGMGCPKDFNPPVHWNEIYDNKLWWLPDWGMDRPENRKKYYTINDLKDGAASAREYGCEALYLDPGWDTIFGSKIWDEERLGKMSDFAAMLQKDYGLRLSLHTPLSGWCDPSSYPDEMMRVNRDGTKIDYSVCGASRQYVDETVNRLSRLADASAAFLMFDGTMFNGPCWNKNHGHSVPSTRHNHVEATNRVASLLHEKFSNILIEMHDQILGGAPLRYVPIYYGYGSRDRENGAPATHGFDAVWGFELMWSPMKDLVGGHSMALYYYNLAYSLPLYLHIDLRKDNPQCLMFWWNASTCRHLGIGGTHPDPNVRNAQKAAMADYRRLEKFFKQGTFYGLDEMVHVHTHPSEFRVVMNVFNLEDKAAKRRIEFKFSEIGLSAPKDFTARSGELIRNGDKYILEVAIPALGHTLVELT